MFCGRTDSPRLPNSGRVPAILETFVQVSCPHPKRLFHSKQRRTDKVLLKYCRRRGNESLIKFDCALYKLLIRDSLPRLLHFCDQDFVTGPELMASFPCKLMDRAGSF